MSPFKNPDELNLRNLTEVIYTSGRILTHKFPYFYQLMRGLVKGSPSWYMLNVLLVEGVISPRKYSLFKKNERDFTPDNLIPIVTRMMERNAPKGKLNNALIGSYISALIILSNPKIKENYFLTEMCVMGAVDKSVSPSVDSLQQIHYEESFKAITEEEWQILRQLQIN